MWSAGLTHRIGSSSDSPADLLQRDASVNFPESPSHWSGKQSSERADEFANILRIFCVDCPG